MKTLSLFILILQVVRQMQSAADQPNNLAEGHPPLLIGVRLCIHWVVQQAKQLPFPIPCR